MEEYKCEDEGKTMQWKEIVTKYPSMWVFFSDYTKKGGSVESGTILKILPDDKVIEYANSHDSEIAMSLRTTEDAPMGGYIHGELVEA